MPVMSSHGSLPDAASPGSQPEFGCSFQPGRDELEVISTESLNMAQQLHIDLKLYGTAASSRSKRERKRLTPIISQVPERPTKKLKTNPNSNLKSSSKREFSSASKTEHSLRDTRQRQPVTDTPEPSDSPVKAFLKSSVISDAAHRRTSDNEKPDFNSPRRAAYKPSSMPKAHKSGRTRKPRSKTYWSSNRPTIVHGKQPQRAGHGCATTHQEHSSRKTILTPLEVRIPTANDRVAHDQYFLSKSKKETTLSHVPNSGTWSFPGALHSWNTSLTSSDILPSPVLESYEDVGIGKSSPIFPDHPDLLVPSSNEDNRSRVSDSTTSEAEALEKLRQISDRLARLQKRTEKPESSGKPAVWADGRQELCETLPYFRSYQSACYSHGDFARAFMFDKEAHVRDYLDHDVIISRAGGGLVKDKDTGQMKSGRDQTESRVVQSLRNCMDHFNPVVIIVGVDNPNFPSQATHQYSVLDYFKPTHIWWEKSGNSRILRYRFEKLNTANNSWWQPQDEQETISVGSLSPPIDNICEMCGKSSLRIYLNGWMCLQPSCKEFWTLRHLEMESLANKEGSEPKESELVYDPRFLKQKTPWPNDDHEYSLMPSATELSGLSIPGEDTSQAFWSGIVCPKCGRCTSRLDWTGWECQNMACGYKKEPPHTLIPAISLREPFWPLTDSYTLSRDIHSSLINVNVSFAHGYRIHHYQIPGIHGFIAHMIANKTIVEEPGGPDSMFEELQKTDIGLRRRSMPNGILKGDSYCRHFTVNYGMPYKFIAATASHSFDGAARPITDTRSRLNWAAKLLLTQSTGETMADVTAEWQKKEFNEVLALGYFEAQKINYHDDGEHGLGPTIATLSLGAPGSMYIRMKARHYNGVSAAGVYNDAPPLPGCQSYDARLAAQSRLDALKTSDPRAYRAALKQIPRDLGLKSAGKARDVLEMKLGHGDVVVMHGEALQQYYEHAVEHSGKLRFALTCRYIDPESLPEEDRPAYVVGRDEGVYHGVKVQ